MNRFSFFCFSLAIFLVFTSCDTPLNKYSPKNEDEKKIVGLLSTFLDACNGGDLVRLETTFHVVKENDRWLIMNVK